MNWRTKRLKESNGFVSKRITEWILFYHCLVFGESFYVDHGKFGQIVHPSKVRIHYQ